MIYFRLWSLYVDGTWNVLDCGHYTMTAPGDTLRYDAGKCWKGDVVDCIWVFANTDRAKSEKAALRIERLQLGGERLFRLEGLNNFIL